MGEVGEEKREELTPQDGDRASFFLGNIARYMEHRDDAHIKNRGVRTGYNDGSFSCRCWLSSHCDPVESTAKH